MTTPDLPTVVDAKLRHTGLTRDDPAVTGLRAWNRATYERAGLPYPQPGTPPPAEGDDMTP